MMMVMMMMMMMMIRGVDPGEVEGLDPLKYVGGVRVCSDTP